VVPYTVVELFPVPLCCSQVPYTVVELFPVPLCCAKGALNKSTVQGKPELGAVPTEGTPTHWFNILKSFSEKEVTT
jgi:hypothetical protein